MLNIKIDEEKAIDLLVERVKFWTQDETTIELFEKMYDSYIYSGCFEDIDFDVMVIVDNDYINYCSVISKEDEDFEDILKVYNEQGLGDCSREECSGSFIESVDNEDEPSAFLIRW